MGRGLARDALESLIASPLFLPLRAAGEAAHVPCESSNEKGTILCMTMGMSRLCRQRLLARITDANNTSVLYTVR